MIKDIFKNFMSFGYVLPLIYIVGSILGFYIEGGGILHGFIISMFLAQMIVSISDYNKSK